MQNTKEVITDKMVLIIAVAMSLLFLLIAIGCGDDSSKQDKENVRVFLHQSMNSYQNVTKQNDFAIKKLNFVRSMKTNGSIDVDKYHRVLNEESDNAQRNLHDYYQIEVPHILYTNGKYSEAQALVKDCWNHMYDAMNDSTLLINDTYQNVDGNEHKVGAMKEIQAYQASMKKLNDLYDLQMIDDDSK